MDGGEKMAGEREIEVGRGEKDGWREGREEWKSKGICWRRSFYL